jgi:hypothetical protein
MKTGGWLGRWGQPVMMTRRRRALAASVLMATVLGMAACSSSTKPPASTDSGAVQADYRGHVAVALVQCFISHHLIPPANLANKGTTPPSGSSTWLHDGKVVENERFGDWYSDVGAGVPVHGKIIGEWVSKIGDSAHAWPTNICGPMPRM